MEFEEQIKFSLQTMKGEIELLKRIATTKRFSRIEEKVERIKEIDYDIEGLREQMENCIGKTELNQMSDTFKKYVTVLQFKSVQDDVKHLEETQASIEHIHLLQDQIKFIHKDLDTRISKEETLKRLNCLIEDVNKKLEERPVKEKVRKMVENVDKKVENLQRRVSEDVKKLKETQDGHSSEIQMHSQELDKQSTEIFKKLSSSDGQRIWRHFQRFAEYEDLRDLYSKCIPQLVKFEQKVLDVTEEVENFN